MSASPASFLFIKIRGLKTDGRHQFLLHAYGLQCNLGILTSLTLPHFIASFLPSSLLTSGTASNTKATAKQLSQLKGVQQSCSHDLKDGIKS
jgi:hypothetical protein